MNKGKLSIVIPVYNTKKYLKKCLDSVINQTYKNLEIIIVDDCSPDNSIEIINEYCKKDNRIRFVQNETNLGLFRARVEGSKVATGDYIAFLDSDDYVTIDFYRTMIYNLYENKSDMVLGNTILEYDNGKKMIFNINDMKFKQLEGEEILDSYFRQEGLSFSWHTIWNKVYTMKLWKKALPHYLKINSHFIMTEDFSFSTVLFYYAKKLTRVENDGLYYCKHEKSSSTNSKKISIKKVLKNFEDLTLSFNFVESFLKEKKIFEKYKTNFERWKKLYRNEHENLVDSLKLSKNVRKTVQESIEKFCPQKELIENANYFYSMQTNWNSKYEELKQAIANPKIKYISFDIFDTLIVRPFMKPTDLFVLLDEKYRKLSKDLIGIDFSKIRQNAEALSRKNLKGNKEDVTLDEIYEVLVSQYNVSKEVAKEMKKLEQEAEIHYCSRRRAAYELYEMALSLQKKVICISDMYLPKKVIETILNKNGYKEIEKIYLSSELLVTKETGNLFKYAIKDLDISNTNILHIGDNHNSDVINATKNGITAFHFRKATDIFFDANITNNLGRIFNEDLPNWDDNLCSMNFLGVRTMLGVVANNYFDNPYRTFNSNSDFNADPFLMGYYALGMHLYGVTKWLIDSTMENNYDNIAFMARDGYLPIKAYESFKKVFPYAPQSNYLYISRKAAIPLIINAKSDLYKLIEIISWYDNTPKNVIKYTKNVMTVDETKLEKICKKINIDINKKFNSETDFYRFISVLAENFYNQEEHNKKIKALKEYFDKELSGKTCVFDIGYSARCEAYLSLLCKKSIDTYFININQEEAIKYSNIANFKLNTFYDYKPKFTGLLREILFSECSPSCIEYQINNNVVTPKFEEYNQPYQENFLITTIQNSALEFVDDMITIFGEDIKRLYYQKYYISMPYEMLIHSAVENDRNLTKCITFEDVIATSKTFSVKEQWDKEIKWHNQHSVKKLVQLKYSVNSDSTDLSKKSKITKAIYYFVFDRNEFKEKLKGKIRNHPTMYKIAKKCVSILKKNN